MQGDGSAVQAGQSQRPGSHWWSGMDYRIPDLLRMNGSSSFIADRVCRGDYCFPGCSSRSWTGPNWPGYLPSIPA